MINNISRQVQDIRQSIIDLPQNVQYTCFHLEHHGKRINDFFELSQVPGLAEDPETELVEDPYTENQARIHFMRIRDLIGASSDRLDIVHGIKAGTSLYESVSEKLDQTEVPIYDHDSKSSVKSLLPTTQDTRPRTIKAISLSPWNPPPQHLRAKGHLMYLLVTTTEGEQHSITSHISGFYVNKCTNQKFDPSPRTAPKCYSAHSLLSLLSLVSPSFKPSFQAVQTYNSKKDPAITIQPTNALPSSPWIVEPIQMSEHVSDFTRSQEPYLTGGSENAETLRDWNEEFQSTKELPKEMMQDRVFRERLTSKLFAEYNEAAVRGAMLVARGEVPPLNPTETKDAQIYVYNNVFYSHGADGVGTFASDGGDDAARVATGKDVLGVKTVNQLDIQGLFTPGTVVVDYLGRRLVGQSIVPGIFKQREPGEHQIDYGGVEGKDIIAEHETFQAPFAELSKHLKVKKHAVWDKEGIRHDLEGSVETKGLLGTDGRKYVLDLYRITPLDILWLEAHRKQSTPDGHEDLVDKYPHGMAVLRPELVDQYWRLKLREYVNTQVAKNKETDDSSEANGESQSQRIDVSNFEFTLNPDVWSGQTPQTEQEKKDYEGDEAEVRNACKYLVEQVIPRTIRELRVGETGFPLDGQSLSNVLHKRGINIRYLGLIATQTEGDDPRLLALKQLCVQEMVSRAFKHVANKYLRNLSVPFVHSCLAHLLNCLLGTYSGSSPQPEIDTVLQPLYPEDDFSFADVTPEHLVKEIGLQIKKRFRYDVGDVLVQKGCEIQMLREICLKLGIQVAAKDYNFESIPTNDGQSSPNEKKTNGNHSSNKKKSKDSVVIKKEHIQTFHVDDILNIVPIVKEAAPRSVLAEETLETARLSMAQGQKEIGQELLFESLSLYEQIYGIMHPEVARVYYALSTLYYSLDEKGVAVDLARKAVIISERVIGVDNAETVLAYLNLSLFEHANGNTKVALGYIHHALDLWKLVYGPHHPDSITTMNNAAVMLQSLKLYSESRRWFEISLSVSEKVSGRQSVNTATLLFQLAQALALDRNSKAAVSHMREAYTIFRSELGPEDNNTKEAENWLEQLTQSAVSLAKHAKDIQTRTMLIRPSKTINPATRAIHNDSSSGLPRTRSPLIGQGTDMAGNSNQRTVSLDDSRPIDELLTYINGETSKISTSSTSTSTSKKGSKSKPSNKSNSVKG